MTDERRPNYGETTSEIGTWPGLSRTWHLQGRGGRSPIGPGIQSAQVDAADFRGQAGKNDPTAPPLRRGSAGAGPSGVRPTPSGYPAAPGGVTGRSWPRLLHSLWRVAASPSGAGGSSTRWTPSSRSKISAQGPGPGCLRPHFRGLDAGAKWLLRVAEAARPRHPCRGPGPSRAARGGRGKRRHDSPYFHSCDYVSHSHHLLCVVCLSGLPSTTLYCSPACRRIEERRASQLTLPKQPHLALQCVT